MSGPTVCGSGRLSCGCVAGSPWCGLERPRGGGRCSYTALVTLTWSSCVLDAEGRVIEEIEADRVQSTASIGKIFLLCEVAERLVDGRLDPDAPIRRDPGVAVADSGLWQHLRQSELPVADACLLVAAVSDNWATNVLLDLIGLESVGARAEALGCRHSGLHDRVRDLRTADDPPSLSTGTARELAEVARRIHVAASGGEDGGISGHAARLVENWLLTGVDLSMVAAPFHLDPLAHADEPDRGGCADPPGRPVRLWSKTGTDVRVRADSGVVWTEADMVSFTAIATWDADDDGRHDAMNRMHAFGASLASRVW